MTATQQFIEDAIKGGWGILPRINKRPSSFEIWDDDIDLKYRDNFHSTTIQKIILDPLAWQAVGKTRGWDRQEEHTDGKILGDRFNGLRDKWKKNWHRFIDRLADGKTIEEALQAIS